MKARPSRRSSPLRPAHRRSARTARFARRLLLAVLLAALVLGLTEWVRGHPGDVPWGPLSLADPVGRFTPLKLDRLHGDFPGCRAVLDAAGQRYDVLAPVRASSAQCGYADGVRLSNARAFGYAPAAAVACPLAAALFLWRHQVIDPAADRRFGQPVTGIETYGSYNCRRIGHASEGPYSEHATANAIDVVAFRLRDGRRIAVARDWSGRGAAAAFLRDVRDGGCRIFGTTLSPDYNAAHRDHLHLDSARRGGWGYCR